jgi:hypothetical protein
MEGILSPNRVDVQPSFGRASTAVESLLEKNAEVGGFAATVPVGKNGGMLFSGA